MTYTLILNYCEGMFDEAELTTNSDLTEGLHQTEDGTFDVKHFASLDDALDYARSKELEAVLTDDDVIYL